MVLEMIAHLCSGSIRKKKADDVRHGQNLNRIVYSEIPEARYLCKEKKLILACNLWRS